MPCLRLSALLAVVVLSAACSVAAPERDAGAPVGEEREDEGPPPLPACEDHSDCAGGEACRDEQCRTVCEDNDDCAGFYAKCNTVLDHCVECVIDEHCDDDEVCTDGLCAFHCSDDAQCGDGEACDKDSGACFEKECTENSECQGGYVCTDSRCVSIDPVICEADTVSCDGDEVVECNGDGTRETRTPCQGDERCVEDGALAACLALVCAPNEIGCADDGTAFVCDGTGTGRTDLPCNDGQYCEAGVCRNQQCEPGTVSCEGSALVVCDASGASSESMSCDLSPACDGEPYGCTCVDTACVPRVCQPGTSQCVANGYRRCNADGTAYETPVPCESGDVCAGGACVSSTCADGEALCSGEVLLTCNATNNGWVETSCAASGETCVESADGASCGERVCEPLSSVCSADGSAVVSCNGIGNESTTTPCDADEYCQGGVCHPQVCEPGTRSCAGPASTQVCNAAGSELTVTTCPAEHACEGGSCVPVSCTPDCSGRVCGPDPVCGTSCGSCDGVCDENGQCQTAATSGLEVVLTWDIAGGDLDLQLARTDGAPLCDDDVCHYSNCAPNHADYPDWDGGGTRGAGDPVLEVDDLEGFGPEVITLEAPADGTYFARVHAYRLDPGQSTTATVTVRANGATVGSYTQVITGDNDLWDGVSITWSGSSATATDTNVVVPNATCGGGGGGGDAGVPDDGGTVSCEHSGQCGPGEYCSWAIFLSGTCESGCADDSDCPGSDKCNGSGGCVPSSTPLGARGASCSGDADCEWGYACGVFLQTCQERCAASGTGGAQRSCAGDPDCCPKTNADFCTDDFFGIGASCTN